MEASPTEKAPGSDQAQIYWVWFDLLLDEYFWIEDSAQARAFLDKLKPEGIQPRQISASSPHEALMAAFPDRKEVQRSPSHRQQ